MRKKGQRIKCQLLLGKHIEKFSKLLTDQALKNRIFVPLCKRDKYKLTKVFHFKVAVDVRAFVRFTVYASYRHKDICIIVYVYTICSNTSYKSFYYSVCNVFDQIIFWWYLIKWLRLYLICCYLITNKYVENWIYITFFFHKCYLLHIIWLLRTLLISRRETQYHITIR